MFRFTGVHDGSGARRAAIALLVPHHPQVLVTQFGQRYHRRLDCHGLRGARTIFGPYSVCLLCANGPYMPYHVPAVVGCCRGL